MEFLKEFLGEELYAQVEAKLKGNDKVKLANLAGGEYVSKAKYDDKVGELAKANETLKTLQTTVEQFKDVDIEGLKTEIKTQKTKYDTDMKALNNNILKRDAVDAWLDNHPTKHRQLIRSQFDYSKMTISDDGKVTGIDDIGNGLLTTYADMFTKDDDKGDGGNGGNGGSSHGGNPGEKDPSKMSMDEYIKWRKESN